MTRLSLQSVFLLSVVLASSLTVSYLLLFYEAEGLADNPLAYRSRYELADIPFDGNQSYEYLKQICAFGPRPSGSTGMQKQQELIANHFQQLGGTVRFQEFRARNPSDGSVVSMANLVVEWNRAATERILLCAHYDTRPFPDRDEKRPRGIFVGANDGASGAALLMELGRAMPKLGGKLGVDFILFDGEEFVFNDQDPYFLGSNFFATEYVAKPPAYKYRAAVLLDMVADKNLEIFQERNSMAWADTRPLVGEIWATAAKLGVREFIPHKKYEIKDDHLALHNTARIPTCDIIDFDYPVWHTESDAPQNCSALSLAKVGWVMHEWLKVAVNKAGR